MMAKIKPDITFDGTVTDPLLTREKEDTLQLGKRGDTPRASGSRCRHLIGLVVAIRMHRSRAL